MTAKATCCVNIYFVAVILVSDLSGFESLNRNSWTTLAWSDERNSLKTHYVGWR